MSAEAKLLEMKLELPPAPKVVGQYQPLVIVDKIAYLSGHGPLLPDGTLIKGRVGQDLDLAAGQAAARQAGLAVLATIKAKLNSLDRVRRLIKTVGMVQCTPQFDQHSAVINGCSDLWAELWGLDRGVGARSSVGMMSLPGHMAVEIEAIFELKS